MKTNQNGIENPPVLEWHAKVAVEILNKYNVPMHVQPEPAAAIIARHDHGKRYAESLQQIAEEMGAPFESGPKIVQRVKALKAQHAETLRLLAAAVRYVPGNAFTADWQTKPIDECRLLDKIRAHLAAQKGTQ